MTGNTDFLRVSAKERWQTEVGGKRKSERSRDFQDDLKWELRVSTSPVVFSKMDWKADFRISSGM